MSRRIEDEQERKRLRDMIVAMRPDGMGFIARTAAEGEEESKVAAEMDFLLKLWDSTQDKKQTAKTPSLIHKDLSITLRAVRDLFTKEVDSLVIDSLEEYEAVLPIHPHVHAQPHTRRGAVHRFGAHFRPVRHRDGNFPGAPEEGLAQIGWFHRDRNDRSSGQH